ncbi:AsmA family protein [Rhodospirillaceae bacterium SYSU D60014]|uniref:AsmA family protein n=1 Tax=Virgifigura deserti TaxID=2268457 RepID=UPI0013C53A65
MLNKSLIALGILLVLAVAAILIGPSFVDWNRYKQEIAATVEQSTGRDLDITGDISVRVLPTPTLSAEGVRFANMEEGSAPEMATLDTLRVRVAFWPLLRGNIQVEEVVLVNPTILLETTADGRNNWEFGASETNAPDSAPAGAETGFNVSLDDVSIENGTIIYRDLGADTERRVEQLDAEVAAETLRGPFRATGEGLVDGEPVTFDVRTGRIEGGQTASLRLNAGLARVDAALQFVGSLRLQGGDSRIRGRLEGNAADLGGLLAALSSGTGGQAAADQAFALTGNLDATATAVALNDLSVQLGDTTGSGTVTVIPGAPLKADIALTVNRLDLDPLLDGGTARANQSETESPSAETQAGNNASGGGDFALPGNVDADIDLTVVAVTYRGGLMNDLRLAATLSDGTLQLNRMSALLPGGSDIAIAGTLAAAEGAPRFTGSVEASSDNFRSLLAWLEFGLPEVPSDRLRRMSFVSRVTATPATVEIADIDLRLDSSHVRGGVVVALPTGPRRTPGFGVGLAVDQVNLDAYLPRTASTQASAATEPELAGQAAGLPLDALAPLADLAANLDMRIGSLTYNRQTLQGIHLDGTVQQGSLTLRELSVTQFAGGQGKLSGTVTDISGTPRFDTEFDLTVQDAGRVMELAGLASSAPGKLGALALGGTLSGDADEIAYDVAFTIGGIDARGQAEGSAAGLGSGIPRLNTTFEIAADEPGPLLDLAGLPQQAGAGLGALSVTGSAETGTDRLTYKLSVAATGVRGRGDLAGTISELATTPRIDTRLSLHAEEPAPLLRLAGLRGAAAGQLGALGIGGTLAGGGDDMRLDLALTGLGGEASVTGSLSVTPMPARFDVAVEATHPELGELLAALAEGEQRPREPLGALSMAGAARGSTEAFALSDLVLQAGPTRLTGTVDVAAGGTRPRLTADLRGNEMVLGWLTAGEPAATASDDASGGENAGGRWSTEPLDLSALDLLDADVELVADAFILGETRIDQPRLAMTLENGVLEVQRFTGDAYGGSLEMTGRLASRNRPAATASLTATGVAIDQVMRGATLADHVRGPVSVGTDLRTAGASMADLVGALQGGGNLEGTLTVRTPVEQEVGSALLGLLGGEVEERLLDVTERIGALYSAFTDSPNALSGSFRIEDGVLRTEDTTLSGTGVHATAVGSADLAAWTLDMVAQVYGEQAPDTPFATVTLQGPLDEPNVGLSGAALSGGTAQPGETLGGLLREVVPGLTGGEMEQQAPEGGEPAPTGNAGSAAQDDEATPGGEFRDLIPGLLEELRPQQ